MQKYQKYANQYTDPKLIELFQTHAQYEQMHLNTINQILNDTVPTRTNI